MVATRRGPWGVCEMLTTGTCARRPRRASSRAGCGRRRNSGCAGNTSSCAVPGAASARSRRVPPRQLTRELDDPYWWCAPRRRGSRPQWFTRRCLADPALTTTAARCELRRRMRFGRLGTHSERDAIIALIRGTERAGQRCRPSSRSRLGDSSQVDRHQPLSDDNRRVRESPPRVLWHRRRRQLVATIRRDLQARQDPPAATA